MLGLWVDVLGYVGVRVIAFGMWFVGRYWQEKEPGIADGLRYRCWSVLDES
jgi:hypothetical protein